MLLFYEAKLAVDCVAIVEPLLSGFGKADFLLSAAAINEKLPEIFDDYDSISENPLSDQSPSAASQLSSSAEQLAFAQALQKEKIIFPVFTEVASPATPTTPTPTPSSPPPGLTGSGSHLTYNSGVQQFRILSTGGGLLVGSGAVTVPDSTAIDRGTKSSGVELHRRPRV